MILDSDIAKIARKDVYRQNAREIANERMQRIEKKRGSKKIKK